MTHPDSRSSQKSSRFEREVEATGYEPLLGQLLEEIGVIQTDLLSTDSERTLEDAVYISEAAAMIAPSQRPPRRWFMSPASFWESAKKVNDGRGWRAQSSPDFLTGTNRRVFAVGC